MSQSAEWIVTLAEGYSPREVAGHLRSAGADIEALLEAIGCIVVRANEAILPRLRSIPGVAHVESSAGVDIGPPDGETTW